MTQPLPELGRYFLVELELGLDRSRLIGISTSLMLLPGVKSVTDVAAISRETLDVLLLPAAYKIPAKQKRG